VLAIVGMTVLALLPISQLPSPLLDLWDKAQHAAAFAVLAFLARLGWPTTPAWRTALVLLAYGAVIELAQGATGYRFGDVADFVADAVGVMVGLGVAVGVGRRLG
jgi:VanZ family protein